MKKNKILKVDSPEYRDIVTKLLGKSVKFSLPPLQNKPSPFLENKTFTENKDVDLLILSNLNDRDLFNACLINKYVNSLCKKESFWQKRFYEKFNRSYEHTSRYKKKEISWRNTYLSTVKDLSFFQNPWDIFNFISFNVKGPSNVKISNYIDKNDPFIKIPKDDESFKYVGESSQKAINNYFLENLGQKVTLRFIFNDIKIDKEYDVKNSKNLYLTPEELVDNIYNFYREYATLEEINNYIEIRKKEEDINENKISKLRRGKIPRYRLLEDGDFSEIFDLNGVKIVIVF